jgi:hypothetical protein
MNDLKFEQLDILYEKLGAVFVVRDWEQDLSRVHPSTIGVIDSDSKRWYVLATSDYSERPGFNLFSYQFDAHDVVGFWKRFDKLKAKVDRLPISIHYTVLQAESSNSIRKYFPRKHAIDLFEEVVVPGDLVTGARKHRLLKVIDMRRMYSPVSHSILCEDLNGNTTTITKENIVLCGKHQSGEFVYEKRLNDIKIGTKVFAWYNNHLVQGNKLASYGDALNISFDNLSVNYMNMDEIEYDYNHTGWVRAENVFQNPVRVEKGLSFWRNGIEWIVTDSVEIGEQLIPTHKARAGTDYKMPVAPDELAQIIKTIGRLNEK